MSDHRSEIIEWCALNAGLPVSLFEEHMARIQPLPECGSRCYEPGVLHEHRCLASSAHPGLEHTCACGTMWPDVTLRVEGGQTA